MNIIQKYGSYAKAKSKLDTLDKRLYGARALKFALLQYRREHGVYEAGDDVLILTLALGNTYSWKVESFDECMIELSQVGQPNEWAHITEITHTTDAEIKAKRCLDDEPKWGRAVELERLNQITITSTPSGEASFYHHAIAEAKRSEMVITWDEGRDITNELNGDKVD